MMQFVNTKSLTFYKSKFEQIIPYIFLLILLCSCLRMFPEIWSQKNNSPYGNPLLLGDYPVWAVYVQKISAIKLSDFWPFGISVRTFFAGMEWGHTYSTPLIVPYLMAQVVSASMAIKLCVVMTVVVLYLSIYRLCSRFSRRNIASISAFVVVLGVMNSNVFKDGMWYNFLSIGFSAYFIYWLDSYLYHSTKLNFLVSDMIMAFGLDIKLVLIKGSSGNNIFDLCQTILVHSKI